MHDEILFCSYDYIEKILKGLQSCFGVLSNGQDAKNEGWVFTPLKCKLAAGR